MRYIALGVAAFVIAEFFDLAAFRGWQAVKQAIGLVTILLFGDALIMIALDCDKLQVPVYLSYAGWVLRFVFGLLLIYSPFLEIPFTQTYVAVGAGEHLVKTGTYALVRRPGVLRLALFLPSLVLASRSRPMLLATPTRICADVLYVRMQEKVYFGRMFPGYERYKKETPMLIPTRTSIGRCYRSFRKGRRLAK